VVLVHDLTNRKSHNNLSGWLSEFYSKGQGGGPEKDSTQGYDPEKFVEQELPVLIVGTKLDQLGSHRSPPSLRGENMLGANSISVVRRYYHTLNILIHIDAYML
jgi:hypothetical protein